MSKLCNVKNNIKGIIHQCGKPEGHYSLDDLHGCSCGYYWDLRGSYYKGEPPQSAEKEPDAEGRK